MDKLRSTAKVFTTSIVDVDVDMDVDMDQCETDYVITIDSLIYDLLIIKTDYYIKGGKTFNHYYPYNCIPTSDIDLVATDEVCTYLFNKVKEIIFNNYIYVETYEVFVADNITETNHIWKDKYNGKTLKKNVRTLNVNGVNIIDVIIVNTVHQDEYQIEYGVHYMRHDLFIEDLRLVYEDRIKKIKWKGLADETRQKYESKLYKSRYRLSIACE